MDQLSSHPPAIIQTSSGPAQMDPLSSKLEQNFSSPSSAYTFTALSDPKPTLSNKTSRQNSTTTTYQYTLPAGIHAT
jgi:hypothetical protein